MNPFLKNIFEQPLALEELKNYYSGKEGLSRILSLPRPDFPIYTGMGASFHAIQTQAPLLHPPDEPALIMEASDLLNYDLMGLIQKGTTIFVSQSGRSAEVGPIISLAKRIFAVTNDENSPLARNAEYVLPIFAGPNEAPVASRTYINTIAILWLLARHWSGLWNGTEFTQLASIIDRFNRLLKRRESIINLWDSVLGNANEVIFIGYGPHAATARQASMMLGEWAKIQSNGYGAGEFRHGLIEIVKPGLGIVIFAAPGKTYYSALALAKELSEYEAHVIVIENGASRTQGENPITTEPVDEFLSPILDIIPAEFFIEAVADRKNVQTTFRYIQKVVTKL
jgi:glucosamine--fructose-6-phosphate aminotransferase (isomerizing)